MPRLSRDGDGSPGAAVADSRLSLLRELGEQAVLETIFRKGPITRPEIAAATNLSKPTVSAAVNRLEQGGLVHAAGRRAGQRGRNPVAYVVSSRAGFVVGADIGGSNVRVAAADLFGEPICDLKRPTAKESSRAVGAQILAAVSERWFGLARGVSTVVFIAIGAGIGMGIIIDDELVRGAHGAAGEIGYLPLVGDPFNPRHRLHGGLEDEIGAAGIVAAFNEQRGPDDPESSSVHEVFDLAADGHEAARAIVDHVASRLGTAIATVCAILDPELVVLGGGIGASALLLRPVRGAAAALVPITARIETSLLGDRAALQGAVAVALHAARTKLLSRGVPSKSRGNLVAMAQPRR